MLRSRYGHIVSFIGLLLSAAPAVMAPPRVVADEPYQAYSTLGSQVPHHDLNLDATIASMVRRGLLADIAANKPTPLPLRPPLTAPEKPQPNAAQNSANSRSGWRAANSGNRPNAANSNPHVASRYTPHRPHTNFRSQPRTIQPLPAALPTLPQAPAEQPALQPGTMDVSTAAPIESAPTTTVTQDAPPEEHLAPIDDLPETPAPSHDAPGDPREPEIGDEQLEGALGGAAKSMGANGSPAKALPDRSSVAGSQLTPIGEPDRVEKAPANGPAPEDPEKFEQPDDATTPTPQQRVRPLSRNQKMLREKVRRVLKHYYQNPLHTGDRSPWEVMHQMLAFEVYSRIRQEGPHGQPVTAVGWLCFNRPCKGRTLMYLNEDGDLRVKVGPALQGHHGQLLALLAQARVRSDYPLRVDGKDFTVADLIEMEKSTCYPRTELTFKLIGLQRYIGLDSKWMNDQGMQWDFPTMIKEEMAQPVRTAACGGTHRLSGLILTAKRRQRNGQPMDGAYAEAARFVSNYQNYAYRLQNPDGSFSTEWFKGPGSEDDIDRRLKTTGHQLEFLIYAATDEQLTYYRTVKAVNYLANIMWANRDRDWEAGPLGHALHALVLYDRLVFSKYDRAPDAGPIARRPSHVVR